MRLANSLLAGPSVSDGYIRDGFPLPGGLALVLLPESKLPPCMLVEDCSNTLYRVIRVCCPHLSGHASVSDLSLQERTGRSILSLDTLLLYDSQTSHWIECLVYVWTDIPSLD